MADNFVILLVEDHDRLRQIYASEMEELLQVDVVQAANYAEALAKLHAEKAPDLVIADLELPGGSGEELLTYIRREPSWQTLPVMILTGADAHVKEAELLRLGADDFIEKGGSPPVLLARIRAQMRHKLARDRLSRLALDRDLFAAGVLQDIRSSKGTITALCQNASALLRAGPLAAKPEILAVLDKLSAHASRLGSYASEIIQTVRATQQTPELNPQEVAPLLEWVTEMLSAPVAVAEAKQDRSIVDVALERRRDFSWQVETPLAPVLADKNLLRLLLLKIVERALQVAEPGTVPRLTLTQTSSEEAGSGRRFLILHCADNGPPLAPANASRLLSPRLAAEEAEGEDWALGLTLVESAMRRMGGHAWSEAGSPRGAIIHLALLASADTALLR